MVVIDTSIIIDHLRQQLVDETVFMKLVRRIPKEQLLLSVITVQELFEGKSTRDTRKEEYLLMTITPLKIVPYTFEMAQRAGEIARDLKRPIELADAAIAATALITGASLFTLNKKDFQGIEDLELI